MQKFTLYAKHGCPFCKKVLEFIQENKLEEYVETAYIDIDEENLKALVEGGGKKTVPCLHWDDNWMYESDDIIEFLREKCL